MFQAVHNQDSVGAGVGTLALVVRMWHPDQAPSVSPSACRAQQQLQPDSTIVTLLAASPMSYLRGMAG